MRTARRLTTQLGLAAVTWFLLLQGLKYAASSAELCYSGVGFPPSLDATPLRVDIHVRPASDDCHFVQPCPPEYDYCLEHHGYYCLSVIQCIGPAIAEWRWTCSSDTSEACVHLNEPATSTVPYMKWTVPPIPPPGGDPRQLAEVQLSVEGSCQEEGCPARGSARVGIWSERLEQTTLECDKKACLPAARTGNEAWPGDRLLYDVTVKNMTPVAAEGIEFADAFTDTLLQLVTGTVKARQGEVACGNGDGDVAVVVRFDRIEGHGHVQISFEATVSENAPPTTDSVFNQAWVSGSNITTEVSNDPETEADDDATVTKITHENQPRVVVSKSVGLAVDADRDNAVSPGDTLAYTVTVVNSGDALAHDGLLTDSLSAYLRLAPESVRCHGQTGLVRIDGNSVEVQLASIRPKDTVTVELQAHIPPDLTRDVLKVSNQAYLNGSNFREVSSDDPSTPQDSNDPTETVINWPAPPLPITNVLPAQLSRSSNVSLTVWLEDLPPDITFGIELVRENLTVRADRVTAEPSKDLAVGVFDLTEAPLGKWDLQLTEHGQVLALKRQAVETLDSAFQYEPPVAISPKDNIDLSHLWSVTLYWLWPHELEANHYFDVILWEADSMAEIGESIARETENTWHRIGNDTLYDLNNRLDADGHFRWCVRIVEQQEGRAVPVSSCSPASFYFHPRPRSTPTIPTPTRPIPTPIKAPGGGKSAGQPADNRNPALNLLCRH